MSAFILILISVLSFVFYGVVGQDKGPLLAPAFVLSLAAIIFYFGRRLINGAAALKRPEPGRTKRLPVSSLLWLVFLAWGAWLVPDALMTFDAKIRMVFIATVIGAYLVWGQELTAFKDNRIIVGWLIFIVMLLAFYGMIVHFKCPERVLWTERYTSYEGRLMSTYICPNHFAHLMQMLLPFCLALLFIPQTGIYLKILAAYSFVVMLPPLFLTESRAGWLGSIACVGTVIGLMALRRSKKLFAVLVVLIPLCSVLILAGAWRFSETFQRRMQPVVTFLEGQAEEGIGSEARDFRPQTWMDTLDMIREKPLTGYGPAAYRYAYPEFRKRWGGQRMVTGHPHNEYLELTADFGLIGFLLFAAAWLYGSIWMLVRSLKAEETRHAFMGFAFLGTVAGTMVHSFFDFQMHVFPNAMIFALLAAVAAGPLKRSLSTSKAKKPGRGIVNVLQPALLTAVFVFVLAIGVPLMASSAMSAVADQQAERKSTEAFNSAAALYRKALKTAPDNWQAYSGMGRVLHHERRHRLEPDQKVQLA
ncbi:O-antigen ligase family protein, partial [Pontiella sp.]|uniref:O-antigen ligase family protein n=1 Tax=Pontiella sp. TaxID=2837462 RepID=UPI0035622F68